MSFFDNLFGSVGGGIVSSLAKVALLGYASKLLNNTTNNSSQGQPETVDPGVRLQLNPSTENQIPILYGDVFLGGNITDAQLSSNYKTMTYCLTLAEITGEKLSTGSATSYTFKNVYLNNNRVVFKSDGYTVDYTLDSSGNQDISMRDLVKVYVYGGSTGLHPTGYAGTTPSPYLTMPGWTTLTHPMSGLLYAIVQVTYNKSKNVSGLPECIFNIESNMTLPGDVLIDYMTNTTYGAGIDPTEIDGSSFVSLNSYCSTGFTYKTAAGTTTSGPITIGGLVDTKTNVLTNIEELATAGSAWISYDIHSGYWVAITNKAGSPIVTLTDDNIVGEISISGTSLTQLNNVANVKYQNSDILDKTDFVKITIPEEDLFQNEPRSSLEMTLPFNNQQAVALKLGLQLLKQARVDKIISFKTDYSYMNLRAGDIIGITSAPYEYTNKAFRIITVEETEGDGGNIILDFKCLEYDATVYDYDIQEYYIETDDGILGIGSIGKPDVPTVTKTEQSNVPKIVVNAKVPSGIVDAIEFWITFDTSVPSDANRTYIQFGTFSNTGGQSLTENQTVSYTYSQLSQSNFFVKVRGVNSITTGPYSDPTGLIEYIPVVVADTLSDEPVSIGGQLMTLGLLTLLNNLDKLLGSGGKGILDTILDELFPGRDPNVTDATEILKNDPNFTSELSGTINNLNNVSIDELGDVNTTSISPTKGNVLAWDGTNWVPADNGTPTISPKPETGETPEATQESFIGVKTYPEVGNTLAPTTGSYYMKVTGTMFGGLAAGSGNIKLYKTDGTLVETLSAGSLIFDGKLIEFPFSSRTAGTDYYILMDKGVFTLCGSKSAKLDCATDWYFTTALDTVSPYSLTKQPSDPGLTKAVSISPVSPACPDEEFEITFNGNVKVGSGTLTFKRVDTGETTGTISASSGKLKLADPELVTKDINGVNETKKVTPTESDTIQYGSLVGKVIPGVEHYIIADAGIALGQDPCGGFPSDAIVKENNRKILIKDEVKLATVDWYNVTPMPNVDNKNKTINIDRKTKITINFNQPIQPGVGSFKLYSTSGLVQNFNIAHTFETNKIGKIIEISGNSIILNPTASLSKQTTYYITADANVVYDYVAPTAPETIDADTAPAARAIKSSAPGVTPVVVGTAGQPLQVGDIWNDTSTLDKWDPTSVADKYVWLEKPTKGWKKIDNCLPVNRGPSCSRSFAGLTDITKIRFTTDPGPSSKSLTPANGVTGPVNETGIVANYDRPVVPGEGTAKVYDSNNNLVAEIPSTHPAVSYTSVN